MSENNPGGNANGASGANSGVEDQKQVSYDSYSKVLGEKKKMQSQYEQAQARIAELEQGSLEADGKIKEAYELQKKQTEQVKTQFGELYSHVTNKVLKQKVYGEVEKYGGLDPETVYKIMDFEGIEFTKEFDLVDETILTKKIQEIAKNKPFLFKKDVKAPNDRTPNNSGASVPHKPVAEMSKEEQMALLTRVNAAQT